MLLQFDDVSISTDRREVRRGGKVVPVQPQVFDLLVCLIDSRDRVVSRDELIERIWQGRIVSESTLDSRINAARTAIGDTGRDQRYLQTAHGRGFRFIGALHEAVVPDSVTATARGQPVRVGFLAFETDEATRDIAAAVREAVSDNLTRNPFGFLICDLSRNVSPAAPSSALAGSADLVVTGSVHRQHGEIHLAVQLIETDHNTILAAVRRDVEAADRTRVVDTLTEAMVNGLFQGMYGFICVAPAGAGQGTNTAYGFLKLAMAHNRRLSAADNRIAEEIALEGLARFEGFAPLHAFLSFARVLRASSLWGPEVGQDIAAGLESARRALAIDGNNSWALQMQALALACQGRKAQGLLASERAIKAYARYSGPYKNRSVLLAYLGRPAEALRDRVRASEMNPDAFANDDLDWGRLHYLAGRNGEALPHLERYAIMAPLTDLVELILAATHDAIGNVGQAAELVAQHREALPWSSIALVRQVTPYPEPRRGQFHDFLRRYGLPEV